MVHQEVHGGGVERGREDGDSPLCSHLGDVGVPLPRSGGLGVQVVEPSPGPGVAGPHDEMGSIGIQRHRVGRVRLEFDGVSSTVGRDANEFEHAIELTVVIRGRLGDHEDRTTRADLASVDGDARG